MLCLCTHNLDCWHPVQVPHMSKRMHTQTYPVYCNFLNDTTLLWISRMQGIFIHHRRCGWTLLYFIFCLQWCQDEMESVRYFQRPCLIGLVQYSFKGHNSLKTATATPLPPYGLQVWIKQEKSRP